ncbi:MAG TPA: hypothetical protein PKA05_13765 [Roseiflexaceae bacterium]|nr:hypothetical protein [Roseiflexaceae bacterium]HMP41444.1 hypothetical protein [Roseiflexaceae bacterium]
MTAESDANQVQQLLQEGRAAALAGDTIAARSIFRRATELDPARVEAWIGLSSVTPVLSEKRDHLLRALDLAPENEEATASLRYVDKLIGEGMRLAPNQRRVAPEPVAAEAVLAEAEPEAETAVLPDEEHCYIHPDRETGLRCTQCNRLICAECAQLSAVGQLCPECRRVRRPVNYQVEPEHWLLGGAVAFGVALGCAILVGLLLGLIGFFGIFLSLIIGPIISDLIVRAVDRVTRAKRGRSMQVAVGVAIAAGTLPLALMLTPFLLLYMAITIGAAATRLR